MPAGRPLGSKSATGGKPWTEAIRKAVMTGKNLEKLAQSLVIAAQGGDIAAMREMGDRLEGKAVQTIDANVKQTVLVGTLKDFGE